MKKKKCQAISKNTQQQCKNYTLLDSNYCEIHYPKKQTIEFFILGVLLTFLCQVLFGVFTISSEEKRIIDLQKEVETLREQNKEIINGKNMLISQNKELKAAMENYQSENIRLRKNIRKIKSESFDVFPGDEPYGGTKVYYRGSAIKKHYNSALDDYENGNIESAKETLELILEKSPHEVDSLNLLGIILNELGNPKEALECLNKAYETSKEPAILNNINIIKQFPGEKIGYTEIKK